ncbi:MAG: hypothetical protein ACE5IW_11005 [bacterium]
MSFQHFNISIPNQSRKRVRISIPNQSRKHKLLKSSPLRTLWNYVGQRKKFLDCFGGCGDSYWWKEDVSIAFTKPKTGDFFGQEKPDPFNVTNNNPFEVPDRPRIQVTVKHGMMICWECFVKKSEQELMLIFDNVKSQWMKNHSNPERIQQIRDYKLLLPIRTTTGIFKKEMTEIPKESNSSFFNRKILRTIFSLSH